MTRLAVGSSRALRAAAERDCPPEAASTWLTRWSSRPTSTPRTAKAAAAAAPIRAPVRNPNWYLRRREVDRAVLPARSSRGKACSVVFGASNRLAMPAQRSVGASLPVEASIAAVCWCWATSSRHRGQRSKCALTAAASEGSTASSANAPSKPTSSSWLTSDSIPDPSLRPERPAFGATRAGSCS